MRQTPVLPSLGISCSQAPFTFSQDSPPRTPTEVAAPLPFTNIARHTLMRRNSSMNSLLEDESKEDMEWSNEEEDTVAKVYEDFTVYSAQRDSPYVGLPPPNLLHTIARAVLAFGGDKWPHSLGHTRKKVVEIARARNSELKGETIPSQGDPEATPRKRKTIHRQDSMDLIPSSRNEGELHRLSGKLQKIESRSEAPIRANRKGAHMSRTSSAHCPANMDRLYCRGPLVRSSTSESGSSGDNISAHSNSMSGSRSQSSSSSTSRSEIQTPPNARPLRPTLAKKRLRSSLFQAEDLLSPTPKVRAVGDDPGEEQLYLDPMYVQAGRMAEWIKDAQRGLDSPFTEFS